MSPSCRLSAKAHGKAAQRQIINEKQVIRILSCILRCYDCHKKKHRTEDRELQLSFQCVFLSHNSIYSIYSSQQQDNPDSQVVIS